ALPSFDEEQPAVVALAVHPAGQTYVLAGVGRAKGATGVGTVGVHKGLRGVRDFGAERRRGGAGCQGTPCPGPTTWSAISYPQASPPPSGGQYCASEPQPTAFRGHSWAAALSHSCPESTLAQCTARLAAGDFMTLEAAPTQAFAHSGKLGNVLKLALK